MLVALKERIRKTEGGELNRALAAITILRLVRLSLPTESRCRADANGTIDINRQHAHGMLRAPA